MIAIYTQNRQAVWNFADISRFHVTGNGTGIQAVAKNGAGGELARYKNREQCTYVLEMLMSAFDADERTFVFPTEKELEHAVLRALLLLKKTKAKVLMLQATSQLELTGKNLKKNLQKSKSIQKLQ